MKLRLRLSLFFFIVIFLGAGMTLFLVRASTENLFRSFIFSGDAEKAKIYASILSDYYGATKSWKEAQGFLSEIPELLFYELDRRIHGDKTAAAPVSSYPARAISALLSDRIAVADSGGVIVADTSGKLLGSVHPPGHLAQGVPIMVNFERVGTVLVGSMVDSSLTGIGERYLETITRSLLWATLLSASVALVLGLGFSVRLSRPISSLTAAVKRVAAGDLSTTVRPEGRDEISELSVSFNAMTEELKRLEEAKKQIIADSAHELRTPVTLIQGTIEAMIDGVYPLDISTLESVHEETIRLSRLIDTLRELEIIESGSLELALEEVDAAEVARKAVNLFTSSAKEKGIRLYADGKEGVTFMVRADYLRLGEVVYNLLSNAIKYTPSGGEVRVAVSRDARSNLVEIAVDDSGPGIPADERERVFERFYRIDRSRATARGGSGLGLAIAAQIVKAHGGSLTIGDSDLGGASFVIAVSSSTSPL